MSEAMKISLTRCINWGGSLRQVIRVWDIAHNGSPRTKYLLGAHEIHPTQNHEDCGRRGHMCFE